MFFIRYILHIYIFTRSFYLMAPVHCISFSWWHHDDYLMLPSWGGCYAIVCTYIVCTQWDHPILLLGTYPVISLGTHMRQLLDDVSILLRTWNHFIVYNFMYVRTYVRKSCISYERDLCVLSGWSSLSILLFLSSLSLWLNILSTELHEDWG